MTSIKPGFENAELSYWTFSVGIGGRVPLGRAIVDTLEGGMESGSLYNTTIISKRLEQKVSMNECVGSIEHV